MQEKTVPITLPLLDAVVQYLAQRPYAEVFKLLPALQHEVNAYLAPKPSETPEDPVA